MENSSAQKHNQTGVDLARVREAIVPVLSAHGVSLVDLEWATDRIGWVLRVTIEHEGSTEQSGGVTLEDCVDVSRGVSSILDADEDMITAHYHLEVSSPGVDRPLRTPAEFARFVGSTVKVKLSQPAPDGQRLLKGQLAEATSERVAVIVDGKRIEVPFADVAQANLVYELASAPKKGAPKGAPKKGAPKKGQKPNRDREIADKKASKSS